MINQQESEQFIRPTPPGEILEEEFIKPYGLSQNKLAYYIKVPPRRINEIIKNKRSITVNTALRLSKFFGTSAKYWLNLQRNYELRIAKLNIPEDIKAIERFELADTHK